VVGGKSCKGTPRELHAFLGSFLFSKGGEVSDTKVGGGGGSERKKKRA